MKGVYVRHRNTPKSNKSGTKNEVVALSIPHMPALPRHNRLYFVASSASLCTYHSHCHSAHRLYPNNCQAPSVSSSMDAGDTKTLMLQNRWLYKQEQHRCSFRQRIYLFIVSFCHSNIFSRLKVGLNILMFLLTIYSKTKGKKNMIKIKIRGLHF